MQAEAGAGTVRGDRDIFRRVAGVFGLFAVLLIVPGTAWGQEDGDGEEDDTWVTEAGIAQLTAETAACAVLIAAPTPAGKAGAIRWLRPFSRAASRAVGWATRKAAPVVGKALAGAAGRLVLCSAVWTGVGETVEAVGEGIADAVDAAVED